MIVELNGIIFLRVDVKDGRIGLMIGRVCFRNKRLLFRSG